MKSRINLNQNGQGKAKFWMYSVTTAISRLKKRKNLRGCGIKLCIPNWLIWHKNFIKADKEDNPN